MRYYCLPEPFLKILGGLFPLEMEIHLYILKFNGRNLKLHLMEVKRGQAYYYGIFQTQVSKLQIKIHLINKKSLQSCRQAAL